MLNAADVQLCMIEWKGFVPCQDFSSKFRMKLKLFRVQSHPGPAFKWFSLSNERRLWMHGRGP